MIKLAHLICVVAGTSLLLFSPVGSAKNNDKSDFTGKWVWEILADDKKELPPVYRDESLQDVPEYSLELDIKQKGKVISGQYRSTWRYLSKLEVGDFSATTKGRVAYLKLVSGFDGKVTIRLTLEERHLHWEVLQEEGEHYFPKNVEVRRRRSF